MDRVVGYARTSPGTNDEGTSLPGQKKDVEDYCDENGWDLAEIFSDEDVSGRKVPPQERDGFSDLLGVLNENDGIDTIVTRKKSRISRDTKTLMTLDMFFEMQVGRDIKIWSVEADGPIGQSDVDEDADPMDKMMYEMMEYMKNMLKELEAAMTAQSTRESLRRKKSRGEPVGSTPYGLTTDKQKFDHVQEATEYLPDDEDDDHFKTCVQIINDFVQRDTDPYEGAASPVGREYGMDHTNLTEGVRNVWEKRDMFKEIAEKHRDDLTVLW
jgi:DNA invertase Pin-like site-specific DNA recombinase